MAKQKNESKAVAETTPGPKASTALSTERKREAALAKTSDDSFNAMVRELAVRKDVNIDVVERLFALQEKREEKAAERAFEVAFLDMHAELPSIGKRGEVKDKNGNRMYRHSKFEDVHAAVMPVVRKHGFNIHFDTETSQATSTVVTILSHVAGHSKRTSFTVGRDDGPGRNAAQAVMSAAKYCKRNGLITILNVNEEEMDDDGRATGATREEAQSDNTEGRMERLANATEKKGKPESKAKSGGKKGAAAPAQDDENPAPAGTDDGSQKAPEDGPKPKSPDPDEGIEKFFDHFDKVLPKCKTGEQLNGLWRRDVLGWGEPKKYLMPPDRAALEKKFAERKAELEGE